MLDKLFGGATFQATTRALDAAALRHQVIANNLANVSTPGYKRQEVRFEERLSAALSRPGTPGNSVSDIRPSVTTINNTTERPDGNNVNLESENVSLAINTLRFEVLSQSVGGYFSSLKSVINGR